VVQGFLVFPGFYQVFGISGTEAVRLAEITAGDKVKIVGGWGGQHSVNG
jgi:hypothetical protein